MRIIALLLLLVLSMAIPTAEVVESQPTDQPSTYNLVFLSEFGQRGRYGIYYIDNTRTEPYPLWLPEPYYSTGTAVACSPDGTRLIAAPFGSELQMMNLLTGEITVLPLPRDNYGTAEWSPTHNQIAFDNGVEVFVFDLDTFELMQISNLDGSNEFPTWSPDGNQIAFTNFNNGIFTIYAKDMRTAFSEYAVTGNPDNPYWSLDWLQNNDQVVYNLWNPNSGIYAVSVFDSAVSTILANSQYHYGSAVWSPDETHFAFSSTLAGAFTEMFVARQDGTQITRITHDGSFLNEPRCWLANPLNLPFPATPTPTFTPTNTPTRTPTPTSTPIPLPPANTNLLTNPSFASGLAPWQTVNFSAGGVVSGVLEVTQPTTVEYGVVWQSLNTMLPADTPMRFSVALGNSSAVPKRVQVILRTANWANAAICEFVLPANSALAAYSVRVRTAAVWGDILAQVWTYAPDGLPAVRIDNADLQYQPGLTVNTTPDCLNQGGPILVNGQFEINTAGWSYVDYTSFAAVSGQLQV